MDVSENSGTPKSMLIGFSIINHPLWGTPIFGNTHMEKLMIQVVDASLFYKANCIPKPNHALHSLAVALCEPSGEDHNF